MYECNPQNTAVIGINNNNIIICIVLYCQSDLQCMCVNRGKMVLA